MRFRSPILTYVLAGVVVVVNKFVVIEERGKAIELKPVTFLLVIDVFVYFCI